MFGFGKPTTLPTPDQAPPGRDDYAWEIPAKHVVLDAPVRTDEVPEGLEVALFGLGCFWGAEEIFWQQPGVFLTEVGFAGGNVPNPTYKQVCGGRTGHAEVVRVVYDPSRISTEQILKLFWENHDPTQGNRQGNDVGDQYRSAIFTTTDSQLAAA